jgi:hypothetical protein
MNEPLLVRRESQIAAPPATVFAFLTDPEKILNWMGTEVTAQPHSGGLYLVKGVGGRHARVARGAFREVVPVHRLAYSSGDVCSLDVGSAPTIVDLEIATNRPTKLLKTLLEYNGAA